MKKILPLSIIGIILHSCNSSDKNISSEKNNSNTIILTSEELSHLNIQTDSIRKITLNTQLHLKGVIDVPPQNIYALSVPLGGYLKHTHLLPGTPIQKGEIIAELEDPQYIQLQEEYLNTKIQFQILEKNYFRQKELAEQKAVSDKTFEQVQAEYESTKIKLKALEERLQLLYINPSTLNSGNITRSIKIPAPFKGYVTKVNFSTGKYIPPSEVLFELVNPNDIHLNIKVLEKDLEYLKIGQKLATYTNTNPEKKYNCEIILINKVVNPDGTIDVHCHFENYDENLIPGTYMQADLLVNKDSIYALPKNALIFSDNKYYVFVQKKDNEFEMTEVELSNLQNDYYTGIKNYYNLLNKKIVTKDAYALWMKMKNVIDEE
ncbi:MAG: hemolysin D [Bacteroidia bacterium]|nr:MAG: hemolysin D [Bacteroidia bacterium]